jgi:hypothetical protein
MVFGIVLAFTPAAGVGKPGSTVSYLCMFRLINFQSCAIIERKRERDVCLHGHVGRLHNI